MLTISELAERTGVPPATLRSWEARHGFPRPTRLAGGHRRYAETEVAAVLEVVRHRSAGLALDAAVRRAASPSLRTRSVYAELRREHPELTARSLSKASLIALSHAIEDECAARAEQPLLFGGFQRAEFLQASYPRWTELARTARAAVVFADMSSVRTDSPDRLVEVALPGDAPLQREWVVVCDALDLVEPGDEPAAASADLRRATDLLGRMMSYLDAGR